ncbi:MAG: diguanylate cyclase [Magnetococcus sp. DMHC-6]
MSERSSTMQDRILQIRKQYLHQLPERLAALRQLYMELRVGAQNRAVLETLHRLLHSLKGTSGSFGLSALQSSAMTAEKRVLAAMQSSGYCLDESGIQSLLDDLSELELVQKVILEETVASNRHYLGMPTYELASPTVTDQTDRASGNLIYLCDDDLELVAQLKVQLGCFGYQIISFSDPTHLRQAVAQRVPDVIVMDIIFPAGHALGIDILDEIQRSLDRRVPTIFFSAREDFEARLRSVRAGGMAYFTKPVKPLELVEVLDRLTSRASPSPYHILIVDDEPEIAAYHGAILESVGIRSRILHTPETVLDILKTFHVDLILMDFYMPHCTGQEVAQVIRQIPEYLSLPIVYLSSETDIQKQFSALKVGADGFLTKPIRPDDLIGAVMVRAERMRSLRALMVRDSLTGLFNHTTTKQFLESALANGLRLKVPVCFAMIDLDHFKRVNDTYGHPVGDQVIMAMGRLLQQRLRHSDCVGRYGGEEFAVILQGVSLQQAHQVLDELRLDFSQVRFYAADSTFSVTFSCGVASFPEYGTGASLCEAADRALYMAKQTGRNRVKEAVEMQTEESSIPPGIHP